MKPPLKNLCRKAAVFLLGMCTTSMLYAQEKRPLWSNPEYQDDSTYVGIVQFVKPTQIDSVCLLLHKQKALVDAFWKVWTQMPWDIEQTQSLFADLSRKRIYKASLVDVLLGEMQESPVFVFREWENKEEYCCNVSVRKQEAAEFIDQLIYRARTSAESLYNDAKKLHADGYVYRAAKKYVEALDSLHPAIIRFLPSLNDTGYVDLGCQIYSDYLNVYNNLVITSDIKSIPAIYNEGIPVEMSVSVTQDSVPLRKLGVITEFDGLVEVDPTTDADGKCYFSIDNVASDDEEQYIEFIIDDDYLTNIPPVYGYNPLRGRNLSSSLKIPVRLVDPHALIFVKATDSLLMENCMQIWRNSREDVKFTKSIDSADIVVDIELAIEKEKDIATANYQLTQYCALLNVVANGVANNILLVDYNIKDFRIVLPTSRNDEKVREAVIREINRQMERKLPDYVEGYKYDKREIIWNSLIPIGE